VSGREEEGQDLRTTFQRLADTAPLEGVDLDRVWDAVSGELSGEERREVVEWVARDPSWALAWRVAHDLWSASQEGQPRLRAPRAWGRSALYGALAASLVVGIAVVLLPPRPTPSAYREGEAPRIESLSPGGAGLSRSACVLRWKGPAGATYDLRVTSEDLAAALPLVSGLKTSEYHVPEEFLARLPPGAKLLWQVTARLPDGTVVTGTFVAVGC
jgi:hypothetical protein